MLIGRSEAGEKISQKTFSDILRIAKFKFHQMYGWELSHITIHRDGIGYNDEIADIQAALAGEEIQFDYVAIRIKE